MTKAWIYIPLILLLALLMSTWQGTVPIHTSPPSDDSPSWFIQGAHVSFFDQQGAPQYVLEADALWHYTGRRETVLDTPSLHQAKTPPWDLKAERGHMFHTEQDHKITKLVVSGNVMISQASEQEPSTLQTEELSVFPEQQRASTQAPVRFIGPQHTITARGMEADLNTQHIQFLSNVRGYYALPCDPCGAA